MDMAVFMTMDLVSYILTTLASARLTASFPTDTVPVGTCAVVAASAAAGGAAGPFALTGGGQLALGLPRHAAVLHLESLVGL